MGKDINIEEIFLPEKNKLIEDKEGTLKSKILDEELDVLPLTFNNDGCVEIDTSGYTYITLSRDKLERLLNLIDQAEEEYGNKL